MYISRFLKNNHKFSSHRNAAKKTLTWYITWLLYFQLVLATFNQRLPRHVPRRLRRLQDHGTWYGMVLYQKRFKANFRVTNRGSTRKGNISEEPVPPMNRLVVCLYRLARGDHLHTVGELVGLGI